MLWYTISNIS